MATKIRSVESLRRQVESLAKDAERSLGRGNAKRLFLSRAHAVGKRFAYLTILRLMKDIDRVEMKTKRKAKV